MTIVRFYQDSTAPGMLLAKIILGRGQLLDKILAIVKENGGPEDESVLLSWEDARGFGVLSGEDVKDLERGWYAFVEMDPFDAASLYGYSAADTLLQRGAL